MNILVISNNLNRACFERGAREKCDRDAERILKILHQSQDTYIFTKSRDKKTKEELEKLHFRTIATLYPVRRYLRL